MNRLILFSHFTKLVPMFLVGLSRVLNNGAGFLITIILIRILNVDSLNLGYAQNVLAIFTIISVVSDFGLVEALQRQVNIKNPRDHIFSSILLSFFIKLFIGAIVVMANIYFNFLHLNYPILFLFLSASTIFNSLFLIYNGIGKRIISTLFLIFYVTLLLACTIFLSSYFRSSADLVIASYLIASCITSIFILVKLHIDNLLNYRFKLPNMDFIKICLSNSVFWLTAMILTQTDVIFINLFHSPTQAGYFKSIAQVALIVRVSGLLINTSLLPYIAKNYSLTANARNLAIIKNIYKLLFVSVFALGLLFVFSLLNSRLILNFIFNNSEITNFGLLILPILILIYGSQTIQTVISTLWQGIGNSKNILTASLLQLFLYVFACIPFLYFSINNFLFALLAVELISWGWQIRCLKTSLNLA